MNNDVSENMRATVEIEANDHQQISSSPSVVEEYVRDFTFHVILLFGNKMKLSKGISWASVKENLLLNF